MTSGTWLDPRRLSRRRSAFQDQPTPNLGVNRRIQPHRAAARSPKRARRRRVSSGSSVFQSRWPGVHPSDIDGIAPELRS